MGAPVVGYRVPRDVFILMVAALTRTITGGNGSRKNQDYLDTREFSKVVVFSA